MGHALDNTLQDILVRYKRMDGFETLWLPGTDHAGIATQSVVEKQLESEGHSREKIGREAFLEKVWAFKAASGGKIIKQLKSLGASCDWSRERFTLDPGLSKAVRKVFVDLYNEGLIYRSFYLVNWSPKLQTAISDLEVEHREVDGFLYYFRYVVKSSPDESIVVATTRPETVLGDTAVAVHPDDERYQHLIGKTLTHPFLAHDVTVIADEQVEQAFGTGAVKVTPAHDPNDYEMGKKHALDFITILDVQGRIDCPQSPFHGQDRFEARKNIVKALETKGLLEKKEPYRHSVGHCQRSGVPIEPRLSKQWFVKIAPLAKPAIEKVKNGEIKFVPEQWTNTYLAWMNNINDWCISRQLWWGHQIPVWYCLKCDHQNVSEQDVETCAACGHTELRRDPDVLDTWFSSGLWPFSTLGWPETTPELKKFYPTSVLVTGFDIIFFWVARMVMMGLKFMGKVPFQTVHIHALVRDEHGQKMSKSRGNVVDPLEMMEKFGTDAFRFSMAAFAVQGRDILLSEKRIEGYRNFITKLWNAARFIEQKSKLPVSPLKQPPSVNLAANHWILHRLNHCIESTRSHLEAQRFNDAAQLLYQFIWNDFCDWYLEASKVYLNDDADPVKSTEAQHCLTFVFDQILRLLHPFCPFVTEHIWQTFFQAADNSESESLMTADFPKCFHDRVNSETFAYFEASKELIEIIRNFRSENNIKPKKVIDELVINLTQSDLDRDKFDKVHDYVCTLAKVKQICFQEKSPGGDITEVLCEKSGIIAYINRTGLIDTQAERERITKQLQKWQEEVKGLSAKLGNKSFTQNAPKAVVDASKERLEQAEAQCAILEKQLKTL